LHHIVSNEVPLCRSLLKNSKASVTGEQKGWYMAQQLTTVSLWRHLLSDIEINSWLSVSSYWMERETVSFTFWHFVKISTFCWHVWASVGLSDL